MPNGNVPVIRFDAGWDSFTPKYWRDKAAEVAGSILQYDRASLTSYRGSINNTLGQAVAYNEVADALYSWGTSLFGWYNGWDFSTVENPALALGKLADYLLTYSYPNATYHAMLLALKRGVTIEEHLFTFHEMIDALEIDRVRQDMERERQRRIREQQTIERRGREHHPTEGYAVHHRRLRKQLEDAGLAVVSREIQEYTDNTISTSNEGISYKSLKVLEGADTTDEYQRVIDTVTTICTMLYENGYKFTMNRGFTYGTDKVYVVFNVTGFIDAALHRDVKNCSAEFTEWLEGQVNERVERRQPVTV